MGKRKYDGDSKNKSKKIKGERNSEGPEIIDNDEQPQRDDETNTEILKSDKPQLFDVKHFRKEIQGKQGQTMGQ